MYKQIAEVSSRKEGDGYMNIKVKMLLAALLVSATVAYPMAKVSAEEVDVKLMVEEALKNKTFYHYNTAYYNITNMPETKEKAELLNQLATIQNVVWTEEVQKSLEMLAEMTKTASGKTYYEIEQYVTNSKLGEMDKGYLLGELTSWGRKLVWTEEYSKAMKALMELGPNPTEEALGTTEMLIAEVKNEPSKEFLMGFFQPVKDKVKIAKDLSTMKKIISLQKDKTLTIEQKILELKKLAAAGVGIEIPDEFLTGDSIYHITEAIMGWDIKESTTVEALQQRIIDEITEYIAGLSPIQKIINLQADETLNMEQKVLKMMDIVMSTKGIEIPDEYFTGEGIFSITEAVMGWNIEKSTTPMELQQRINDKIASYEASKLRFSLVNSGSIVAENTKEEALNITKSLTETLAEKLLPETKIVFKEAGWRKGYKNPLEPSEYLYIKNGQVYMYVKEAPAQGYRDSVAVDVQYKNGVYSTNLWVTIVPAVEEEAPKAVEEQTVKEETKPAAGGTVIK